MVGTGREEMMEGVEKEPHQNGFSQAKNHFKKEELVRLLIQSMHHLGYSQSAKMLEEESGYVLEPKEIAAFRKGVLEGEWSTVEAQLSQFRLTEESNLKKIKFLLAKQKYLETLERGNVKAALPILRNEIVPLTQEQAVIHRLTSYMMCSSPDELKKKADWPGERGGSRQSLLQELQRWISPALMIPENRLETLLQQALEYQKTNCLYHNVLEVSFSLFEDHFCDRNQIPRETKAILEGHSDEVWYVEFSNNGKYLASASKDCTVIIWSLESKLPLHILAEHEGAISFVSWSPDDQMLLTCGRDKKLKLWNAKTGVLLRTFSKHDDEVTACAWLPDGHRFLSASPDKNLILWDINGTIQKSWVTPRIFQMAINRSGTLIYLVCEKVIHIYAIDGGEVDIIQESATLTSFTLSRDRRYALANLTTQEIHLWDLQNKKLVRKFTGHRQGNVVIRSCFGGIGETFVVSGSEDSDIYLWHRDTGKLVEVLKGHKSIVNAVSWNPQDPFMFASASDDHDIRVWVVPTTGGRR